MTKRLNEIFREIISSNLICDVGCDHGYIACRILKESKAKKVVATDISQKCLDKAKKLIQENDLQDRAEFCCVDGIPLGYDFDQIVIAGMGGLEIVKILERFLSEESKARFVLQPMRDERLVREFLNKNGYKLIVDRIFKDNKLYRLIVAEKGKQILSDKQKEFGALKEEYKFKDFLEWLELKQEKTLKIMEKIEKNSEKYKNLEKIIKNIEEIKGEIGKC